MGKVDSKVEPATPPFYICNDYVFGIRTTYAITVESITLSVDTELFRKVEMFLVTLLRHAHSHEQTSVA